MHEVSAASLTAVSGQTALNSSVLVTTWPLHGIEAERTEAEHGTLAIPQKSQISPVTAADVRRIVCRRAASIKAPCRPARGAGVLR